MAITVGGTAHKVAQTPAQPTKANTQNSKEAKDTPNKTSRDLAPAIKQAAQLAGGPAVKVAAQAVGALLNTKA